MDDDKRQYMDTLKGLNRPSKVKVKESKEQVLMEQEQLIETLEQMQDKILREIFVQSGEIEAMPKGADRDMQILRLSIIAELDASNLYEKLALLASDKKLVKLLKDISQEEKVHVGELKLFLEETDPEYRASEEEGEDEAKQML